MTEQPYQPIVSPDQFNRSGIPAFLAGFLLGLSFGILGISFYASVR